LQLVFRAQMSQLMPCSFPKARQAEPPMPLQEQKAEQRHAAFSAPLATAAAGVRDWLAASGACSIAEALARVAASGSGGGKDAADGICTRQPSGQHRTDGPASGRAAALQEAAAATSAAGRLPLEAAGQAQPAAHDPAAAGQPHCIVSQLGSESAADAGDAREGAGGSGAEACDDEPQQADYIKLAAMKAALRPKFRFDGQEGPGQLLQSDAA